VLFKSIQKRTNKSWLDRLTRFPKIVFPNRKSRFTLARISFRVFRTLKRRAITALTDVFIVPAVISHAKMETCAAACSALSSSPALRRYSATASMMKAWACPPAAT